MVARSVFFAQKCRLSKELCDDEVEWARAADLQSKGAVGGAAATELKVLGALSGAVMSLLDSAPLATPKAGGGTRDATKKMAR